MHEVEREHGPSRAVLLVDDDASFTKRMARFLTKQRYHVEQAASGEQALHSVERTAPDIVLLDLMLPGIDGLETLRMMRAILDSAAIIVMTGWSSVDVAVKAMRAGATDFIAKPIDLDALSMKLVQAGEVLSMRADLGYLRERQSTRFESLLGNCAAMRAVCDKIEMVAATPDTTVLVTGPSGTGKELVSRQIHESSARAHKPLMQIDCTAIPTGLLESELFGHERGAFTGADRAKKGLLELADGGTLLLDEIGDMPMDVQAKFLRVLEERRFRRVGGVRELGFDARVVAATNQDLESLAQRRLFREDLMFRLKVFQIELPRLCEREGDVMTLAWAFLREFSASFRKPIRSIAPDAEAALCSYSFPGNVRELRNLMEQAVILATGDVITRDLISIPARPDGANGHDGPSGSSGLNLDELGDKPLEEAERILIEQALARTSGNKRQAAELLGISRYSLQRRLDKLEAERSAS